MRLLITPSSAKSDRSYVKPSDLSDSKRSADSATPALVRIALAQLNRPPVLSARVGINFLDSIRSIQQTGLHPMTLEDAKAAIVLTLGRMNAIYSKPLFDEWVLVSLRGQGGTILAYNGPRAESYQKQFVDDLAPIRAALVSREQHAGDFEFAPDGEGTRFDACLKTGANSFLFCNNTGKSMTELRKDLRWIEAQKVFLQLSAKFRAHPLE